MALVAQIVPIALALLLAGAAGGEALDLDDARDRRVQVRFEVSGSDQPAVLDRVYGEPLDARLSPGPGPGEVTVRVPASEMERSLGDHGPVPGSFSDFVWVFDGATGDVLSAELTGEFVRRVDWGFFSTRVVTATRTELSTLRGAGFLAPRRSWGHVVFEYCRPGGGDPDCTPVAPRRLDPETGYVNAVGSIAVRAVGGIGTTSFSPLGEAIFSEAERSGEGPALARRDGGAGIPGAGGEVPAVGAGPSTAH